MSNIIREKYLRILATSGLLIVALIAIHFSTGIFTPFNYFSAQFDIINKNYRLLHYGEINATDSIAMTVSPKFGFKYEIVAHCAISTPLVNGIQIYNNLMTRQLDKTYGSDWFFDFEDHVDTLFRESRVDTIKKIISSQDRFKEMQLAFDKIYHGKRKLSIWVLIHKDNGDNVRVCEKLGDTVIRVFDHYHVDPYSLKLTTIKY